MRFGVTIPNNWGIADPRQVLAMGPLAEALGYDSVWVMDHLLNSGYIRERLDDKPYYHPLATLSYLAATTKRVTLGTSVLVLSYHDPLTVAEALGLLARHGDEARTLAGGQSLVPILDLRLARPGQVIDINRVGRAGHHESGSRRRVPDRSSGPPARARALAADP